MKKLVLGLFVAVFAACSSETPQDSNSAVFLEAQLRDFIKFNPDWTTDAAKTDEITEKFKHKMIKLSNEPDFLKNMPLKLKAVKDTLINDEPIKLAVFKAYGDTSRNENSLLNYMQLQVSGIVSDAQLQKLSIDKNYLVTGTLYKQGKRADVQFIHVAGFKGYDLGKYTFLITGFDQL